jgi:hypothetical protein
MRRGFILLVISGVICLAGQSFYTGIQNSNKDITVQINPVFNSEPLITGTKKYVTAAGDSLYVDQFIFYISAIQLIYEDGKTWQEKESYHLIDIVKTPIASFTLKDIPAGKITRLEFCIGIDSTTSVSGAYGGDLDPMYGMYWSWNSGYINAKLEGRSKSCKTHQNAFEFHIGGYLPKQYSIRKVSLPIEEIKTSKIILSADAAAWFKDISLSATNSIVIPGKEAMQMADNYSTMFKVVNE